MQLQSRGGSEQCIPRPSVEQAGGGVVYISWELAEDVAENLVDKFRRRREQAEIDHGEDWSIEAVAAAAGVQMETADVLRRCGVLDVHDLVRVASEGEANEQLRNVGVSKLGARSKLCKMLSAFWDGQQAKERANELYKKGLFAEAAEAYSAALGKVPCHSSTLSLNMLNNRAAAYQQTGHFTEALGDALRVL
eukprot:2875350-Prymnesium_polylepis.1